MPLETLAGFVLDTSLRAAAAAAAVAVVLIVLRVRAADVRHAAWTGVLAAMLLMPVLPSVAPRVEIPLPSPAEAFLSDSGVRPVTDAHAEAPPLPPLSVPVIVHVVQNAPRAAELLRERFSGAFLAAAAVYGLGVVLLLGRLLAGWRAASKMVARAEATTLIAPAPVRASPEVVTPVTAGIVRPSIIVPRSWTTWPDDTLQAVLAHEGAHVRRRDGLILCVARINRAVFWFHPLAWWLERTLAVTAEHACDEAATRAVGEPRRYAQILVQMAETVRSNGGRIVWQGVGVDGAGLLGTRIDRVLRGDFMRASRARKLVAAVSCAAVLLLVIACRQQITAGPLKEDPVVAKRIAEGKASGERYKAGIEMTPAAAGALEVQLEKTPDDRPIREKLLAFYTAAKIPPEEKVAGKRRHVLWFIEHHPDAVNTSWSVPPIYATDDPAGYEAAKALWLQHTSKPDASVQILDQAASFFAFNEKPLAEALWTRAQTMDPDGTLLRPDAGDDRPRPWQSKLGDLYANAILGIAGPPFSRLRDPDPALAQGPYATAVRQKLEASRDAVLLVAVTDRLDYNSRQGRRPGAPSDTAALVHAYRDRATTLEPQSTLVRNSVIRARMQERNLRFWSVSKGQQTVRDDEKLAYLSWEANRSYSSAEWAETQKKDPAAFAAQFKEARRYAEEALQLAAGRPQDPSYSAVVHNSHLTLGTLDLRDGNKASAIVHLRESVKVPMSEETAYHPEYRWMRLTNELLKHGQHQPVAEFFEGLAKISVYDRQQPARAAAALRAGRMPALYQQMMTSGS